VTWDRSSSSSLGRLPARHRGTITRTAYGRDERKQSDLRSVLHAYRVPSGLQSRSPLVRRRQRAGLALVQSRIAAPSRHLAIRGQAVVC
jgi:hypothetical protein